MKIIQIHMKYLPIKLYCRYTRLGTNKSLKNLLNDLKTNYKDIQYIITRRLNQDILENFFSFVKGMSRGNYHLTPVEFKYKYVNF